LDDPSGLDIESLPRLELVEELRIGSLDGGDYGFNLIESMAVDDQGRIYVFDFQDRQIRVFDPNGIFLHRIGGPGEGPGEFAGMSVRFGVYGDTVWTWSSVGGLAPGRVTLFDAEGRVISTTPVSEVRMTLGGNCLQMVPSQRGADGLFLAATLGGSLRACSPEEGVTDESSRLVIGFRGNGAVVDTIGAFPAPESPPVQRTVRVGGNEYGVPAPPSSEPLFVALPDGRALRVDRPPATSEGTATFRLALFHLGGDTIFSREYRYRPVPYSDATLDEAVSRVVRASAQILTGPEGPRVVRVNVDDSARARPELRAALAFPPFQPPVSSAGVRDDGTIWLTRDDLGGQERRYVVLDPEGTPVGELRERSDFRPLRTSWDTVWAVDRDDFGVPSLVRYRLVRQTDSDQPTGEGP
jgi:hypothetical protein